MPNYGVVQAGGTLTSLCPGDGPYFLFNAESPTAPQASVAFSRGSYQPADDAGVTFQIIFASAPTASVTIQGSNVDTAADYVVLFTSTNKQFDSYTDTARFRFYRSAVASQSAGGAITVTAMR